MTKKAVFGVLAIFIVLISMYVLPKYLHKDVIDKRMIAKYQILDICSALEDYHRDNNCYPTIEQGLEALSNHTLIEPKPANFRKDGYISKIGNDSWGNKFHYYVFKYKNKYYYEVWSYGADSVPGGVSFAEDLRSSVICSSQE